MATDMEELVDDLVSEQDYLDNQLRDVPAAAWATPSPAEGWLLRDCIAHLAEMDVSAATIAATGSGPTGGGAAAPPLSGRQVEARKLKIAERIGYWRDGRAQLAAAVRPLEGRARLPWAGNTMSVRSFTTARLMEAWSHGLDAIDAAGGTHKDSDRLKHIAQIGIMTRDYAYRAHQLEPNPEPMRVELEAPSGSLWTWGPEDARIRITGYAGDFCRVVTQRISYLDTDLKTEGEAAVEFLQVAQAFAGPPGKGRPPKRS